MFPIDNRMIVISVMDSFKRYNDYLIDEKQTDFFFHQILYNTFLSSYLYNFLNIHQSDQLLKPRLYFEAVKEFAKK